MRAPLKYWSCGGSWLVPRSGMMGVAVADFGDEAVGVADGVGAAVVELDEEGFEVGVPALVDPHVGAVGGGDGVAEPLVAGLVNDDEVEAGGDADAGPVTVEIAVVEVVAVGYGGLVLHAGVGDFDELEAVTGEGGTRRNSARRRRACRWSGGTGVWPGRGLRGGRSNRELAGGTVGFCRCR